MKPVAAVVTLLTDALAAAKRGEVRSVAFVSVNPDGLVDTSLALGPGTAGDLFTAAHVLASEILDEIKVGGATVEADVDDESGPLKPLAKTKPATN